MSDRIGKHASRRRLRANVRRPQARSAVDISASPGSLVRRVRSGENNMMSPMPPAVVAMVAAVSGIVLAVEVRAGADRVAFPENYATGVMYLSIDKPEPKQVHQIYAMPDAFEAVLKEEPMPTGTVFTVVAYAAKLDAQGNPVKDADGHFVKGDILAYNVMAKGSGWGSEYPPTLRNGEWE